MPSERTTRERILTAREPALQVAVHQTIDIEHLFELACLGLCQGPNRSHSSRVSTTSPRP